MGGISTKLIDRNTTIPTRKSQVFSTAADGQSQVEVHVLQGEREMAEGNTSLGRFHLRGIPPAPRGIPQIEVTFDLDANGILNVTATDKGSGKAEKLTIVAPQRMDKTEIDKAVREAEAHGEDDRKRREEAELRNTADAIAYSTEKTLAEYGEKITEGLRTSLREKVDGLKKALEGKDLADVRRRVEELSKEVQKVGAEIYQQSGSGGTPPGGEPGKGPDDHVVDADFTEEKRD